MLFMKDDLPTLGNPVINKVLSNGFIEGSLERCLRTSSKNPKLDFNFLVIVIILPKAALFNNLHLYKESPYLINLL
jgi:hypothetical protein